MIKNYFIIAVRNIIRNKIHSLINILGLAIGLASVILILLFIYHELSYDKFHPDAQNTYRLYAYQPSNRYMNSVYFNVTPALFVPTAKQYFPEIKYASRIWMNGGIMSVDDKHFEQEYFYAVDPDFLKMFSVDVFLGDKENALAEPNSIVISKRISDKYFFGENPIGQQINMDDKTSFRVTAVFNELPSNTHFDFDILIHFDNIKLYRDAKMLNSWSMNSYPAYIQLNENISEEQMEQKLIPFIKQYLDDSTQDRYLLQKISDIHLKGHINFEISSNGDIKYIAIFGIIAILILLIASFNYVNLSTARSFKRAKEVGLRKVMGASRNQLIKQYLGESVFITFISLIMALILIEIFIPYFNEFVDRKLSLYNSGNVIFILIIIVTLAISLLAGSYPAIYLSRFTPIKVIKGIVQGSKKTSNFRNILILMQFAISVSLIICTIVVISQLTYIRNKKLGFETENIITIRLRDSDLIKNLPYLKTSLLQNSGILDVSMSFPEIG